jgi:DMSO/TMAO reductase YedYZ molybdopterin-dependent catalytic subunit
MTSSRRHFVGLLAASTIARSVARPAELVKRNMIVRSTRPEDLEMPLDGFSTWITPVERFFVRTHTYVPRVELSRWRLVIDGEVSNPLTLSFADIEKLPRVDSVAVLECAGNGRGFYDPPVAGLQWEYGAVGNGRWTGIHLADLLKTAGVKESAQQITLDGADVPLGTEPDFQRSVPLTRALMNDVLLAYQMNGEPLPPQHGFPLRLIVPGWGGDCWTKWVTRITVSNRETDGFFMKTAYRHPGRAVEPGSPVDPAIMKPVTTLSVKSVIASPVDGAVLSPGPAKIRGVAWSNGSPIISVEVSTDAGRTWKESRFGDDQAKYAWRIWELDWTPPSDGYYTIMARSRDFSGDVQPLAQEWNPSGYLYNVVQRTGVRVGAPGNATATSSSASPELPPAVRSACIGCHETDVMQQQRLSRAGWDREVDKMTRWGAPVKSGTKDEIVRFLAETWGPRPHK